MVDLVLELGMPKYPIYLFVVSSICVCVHFFEVYSLNPAGLRGIDPSGLEHFLVGD